MEGESAVKRLKSDKTSSTDTKAIGTNKELANSDNENSNSCSSSMSTLLSEADKAIQESNKRHIKPVIDETKLGIELFIGDNKHQFHGMIKARYADFIVHEIDLDGKLAKLTDLEPPSDPETGDTLKLEDLFDRKILVHLSNVNNGLLDSYRIDVTGMDKVTRTSIHHAIRESYDRLESAFVDDSDRSVDKNNKTKLPQQVEGASKSIEKAEYPTSTNDNVTSANEQTETKELADRCTSQNLSKTDQKKYILITRRNKSSRHRSLWPRGRPDYTRFVLYKENKDTMDAIQNLAVATNTKPSVFTYAGTKDRRAITSQWICGWRVEPKRLIGAMRRFNKRPYLKVGNFSYQKEPIRLGQLKANKFDIVVRHLVHNSGGEQVIKDSMQLLKENGFVNYFGLQRFGTRAIQTYEVGQAILQSKWEKATSLILSYRYDENSPIESNNPTQIGETNGNTPSKQQLQPETDGQKSVRQQGKYWARGAEQHNACIDLWKSKHDAELVFKKYPHFRITNEGLIIKTLSKSCKDASTQDHAQAISVLPRNTRSMYVHSYQSLLWNKMTTHRLKEFGFNVVVGDLVLPAEENVPDSSLEIMLTSVTDNEPNESRDEDQDTLATSTEIHDSPTNSNEYHPVEAIHSKIITVTEENIHKYSIFDVVLPLPGSRIKIPRNQVGSKLKQMLQEDGLTIDSFRAREKVFVAYGSYRKILVKPENLSWSIKQYSDPRENLIETDIDALDRELCSQGKNLEADTNSPLKSDSFDEALVCSFDLPPSSYATMCLRELMKKPSTDFNNRF